MKGIENDVHKKKWKKPLRHKPDYWLADHLSTREFFAKVGGDNFEKYKLDTIFFLYDKSKTIGGFVKKNLTLI